MIVQFQEISNRPFYSCLCSDLAFEWQRGWRCDSENGGGMQDDRHLNAGCGIKIIWHEQDLFVLTDRMVDSFETMWDVGCGMWDEITGYGCYAEKCNFTQEGSE